MKARKIFGVFAIFALGIGLGVIVSSVFVNGKEKEQVLSSRTEFNSDTDSASAGEISETGRTSNDVKVVRVIDGDTIILASGEIVRYIGINSPESNDCYSQESTNANTQLVLGKVVSLEKDVSNLDKYNRLLRFVWVDDKFVNEQLVREGFAKAYKYPPDVTFADQFVQAEQEARENDRGLWSTCEQNSINAISPSPTAKSTTQYSGADKDCGDFKTHAQAQAFFESAGVGDPHKLDSDDDGSACESLP